VFSIAEDFKSNARSGAQDNAVPTMRVVALKGYFWHIPAEQSKPIAENNIDAFIQALTRPITAEEAKPPQQQRVALPPVKITAKTYSAAIEEYQSLFSENRWSDGLAIIPPTREAVDLMLSGTNRSPGEIIGRVPAKNGIATIEKIAINAVMAGASPKYLPVIIAAMEGFTDKEYDLLHPQASLGGFELAIWVSGPIVAEINMNCLDRLWTYGNRANDSIGRTIVLCRINLGQMWPGVNDMARTRAVPCTNYIFAENGSAPNPWQPFHVISGFKPGDSCVSVSTVNAGISMYPGAKATDKLQSAIKGILAKRHSVFARYNPGVADPASHPPKHIFMISPRSAKELYDSGYTDQKKLRDFIYEQTSVTYEQLAAEEIKGIQARIETSVAEAGLLADRLPADVIPVYQNALKPGGKVPIFVKPEDDIHLVVVGTPDESSISGWTYMRAPYALKSHKTKLIRGATLTEAGR
jgi:hypothetical protein